MEAFLVRHGLERLLDTLRAAELETVGDLRLLTRKDLDQLGIAMGSRNRLLSALLQEAPADSAVLDGNCPSGATNAFLMPLPIPMPLPLAVPLPLAAAEPSIQHVVPLSSNERGGPEQAHREEASTAATGGRSLKLEGAEDNGKGTGPDGTGAEGADRRATSVPCALQETARLPPGVMTFNADEHMRRKQGWTHQEDLLVMGGVRRYGRGSASWPLIAGLLPGRTMDAVRNRYHRLQRLQPPLDPDGGEAETPPPEASGDGMAALPAAPVGWPSLPLSWHELPPPAAPEQRRDVWSLEEERLLEEGVRRFGFKWRKIARCQAPCARTLACVL